MLSSFDITYSWSPGKERINEIISAVCPPPPSTNRNFIKFPPVSTKPTPQPLLPVFFFPKHHLNPAPGQHKGLLEECGNVIFFCETKGGIKIFYNRPF